MSSQILFSDQDLSELHKAITLLEAKTITARLAEVNKHATLPTIDSDTDYAFSYLHNAVQHALANAINHVLLAPKAFESFSTHSTFTAISGAIGGSFGFAGSVLELPLAIRLLLQGIRQIAADHEFPLSDLATHKACIEVFAMNGAPAQEHDCSHSIYYLNRAELNKAKTTDKAVATQPLSSMCATFLYLVAQRFSQTLKKKISLQSQLNMSRVTEEQVNNVFISHYLSMAQGHFMIMRLEKKYGHTEVKQAYFHIHHANAANYSRP